MRELHLFAGDGGGILAGLLLGDRPVCAVEIEPHCRNVLLQRQRDELLPRFPIWMDRLKAIGNAQHPELAAFAHQILSEGLTDA